MIEQVVTSGTFSIDGEDFAVDNNIWLVGDEHEVLIVDAAHDATPIAHAVDDRCRLVGGVDHEALLVVTDDPDVVVDLEVLAVDGEDPMGDDLLEIVVRHAHRPGP